MTKNKLKKVVNHGLIKMVVDILTLLLTVLASVVANKPPSMEAVLNLNLQGVRQSLAVDGQLEVGN